MYEKCRRCRRALTNPESRKIGFGKVCARKSGVTGLDPENVEASAGEVMLVPPLSRPFTGDVVLMRYRDEARANIPHTVILHSPTGFEWGYGGSGPADLALNILNAFIPPRHDILQHVNCFSGMCSETAHKLHQEFKRDFIAGLPKDGGRIMAADIHAWLNARGANFGAWPA